MKRDRSARALDEFDTTNESAEAVLERGIQLADHGELVGALRAFETAAKSRDRRVAAQAYWQLGKLHYQRAELEEASRCFQRAIRSRDPDIAPRGYNGLGAVHAARGEFQEAKAAYERAIASGLPDTASKAARNLGLLLTDHGDMSGARAAFEFVLDSGNADQVPYAALQLGRVLRKLGETPLATSAYKRAVAAEDSRVAARAALELGVLDQQLGDVSGAQEAFAKAFARSDPDQAARVVVFLELLREGTEASEAESALNLENESFQQLDDVMGWQEDDWSLSRLDEAIAHRGNGVEENIPVLREFFSTEVFAVGKPSGDLSTPGVGTESELLHFTAEDAEGKDRVFLPIFTQPSIMRRALLRNPEWAKLSVLRIHGRELYENIDRDVTIVINPWSQLQSWLPHRPVELSRSGPDVRQASQDPRGGRINRPRQVARRSSKR